MKFLRISSLFLALGLFVACGMVDAADNNETPEWQGSKAEGKEAEEKQPVQEAHTPSLGYSWYNPLGYLTSNTMLYSAPLLMWATQGKGSAGFTTLALMTLRKIEAYKALDSVDKIAEMLLNKSEGSGFGEEDAQLLTQAATALYNNRSFLHNWLVSKGRDYYQSPQDTEIAKKAIGSFYNLFFDSGERVSSIDSLNHLVQQGWTNKNISLYSDMDINLLKKTDSGTLTKQTPGGRTHIYQIEADNPDQIRDIRAALGLLYLSDALKLPCNENVVYTLDSKIGYAPYKNKEWKPCIIEKLKSIISTPKGQGVKPARR